MDHFSEPLLVVDEARAEVRAMRGLGVNDFSRPGAGLDAADRDGATRIASQPVFGLHQPDAIACCTHDGMTHPVTANEGETRKLGDFDEAVRVKDLRHSPGDGPVLDPAAFPPTRQTELLADAGIGRLFVSAVAGDEDGDGDFHRLNCFSARSFSRRSFDAEDQPDRRRADARGRERRVRENARAATPAATVRP